MILGIYVDDGIIIGNNTQEITKLTEELKKEFSVTIVKNPEIFLGLKVQKADNGLKLKQITQEKYWKNTKWKTRKRSTRRFKN